MTLNPEAVALILADRVLEIPLTKGQVAWVDIAHYERVAQHTWCALKGRHTYYAVRGVWRPELKASRLQTMHRFILDDFTSPEIDHKDGNGLHNWQDNLRPCMRRQNAANMIFSTNSSGFKGVSWDASRNKWQTHIRIPGDKKKNLGRYEDCEEAARAYDEAAKIVFGSFAKLNFP